PRPPTTPTEILPQQPQLSTSVVPTTELALADGTGAIEPEDLIDITPRSKKPVMIALIAAVLVLGVVAFAMMRDDKPAARAKVADAPRQPMIHVETIPPEEQTPPPTPSGKGSAAQAVEVAPVVEINTAKPNPSDKTDKPNPSDKSDKTEKRSAPDKRAKTADKRVDKKHDKRVAEAVKTPPPPKPELTREAVAAKFRAVKQAYDSYKQKNGGRFDQEWNDLAGYVQYHSTDLEEVARRIESFKAKLRE
ncbi:MAG TPA: hypothetical protein VIV40_30420, partial [Kofleriaceae bacterium]